MFMRLPPDMEVGEAVALLERCNRLACESDSNHFRSQAGAEPVPKRIFPASALAASTGRISFAGADPVPKRMRRESAIFLVGLRTTGCLLLFICFSLFACWSRTSIARPSSGGAMAINVRWRALYQSSPRGKE
jgi:hypothetical protein